MRLVSLRATTTTTILPIGRLVLGVVLCSLAAGSSAFTGHSWVVQRTTTTTTTTTTGGGTTMGLGRPGTALFLKERRRTLSKQKFISVKNYRRPRSIALIPLEVPNEVEQRHEEPAVVLAPKLVTESAQRQLVRVDEEEEEEDSSEMETENLLEKAPPGVIDEQLVAETNKAIEETGPVAALESASVAIGVESVDGETAIATVIDTAVSLETPLDVVDSIETMDKVETRSLLSGPSVDVSAAYFAEPARSDVVEIDKPVMANAPKFFVTEKSGDFVEMESVPVVTAAAEETAVTVGEEESTESTSELEQEKHAEDAIELPNFLPTPPYTEPPSFLLPKREWDANVVCIKAFDTVDQHPILLFDGACNLCNDWVNFCLDFDDHAKFRFASLQSKVGQSILIRDGRSPDDRSDIILATPQETLAKSDALLSVVSQLEGLPLFLRVSATAARVAIPAWFRDAAFKFVSANRHILGDTEGPVCRLDLDGEYTNRFIEDPEL